MIHEKTRCFIQCIHLYKYLDKIPYNLDIYMKYIKTKIFFKIFILRKSIYIDLFRSVRGLKKIIRIKIEGTFHELIKLELEDLVSLATPARKISTIER